MPLTYDADGHGNVMLDGQFTYTWDIFNRMIMATDAGYDAADGKPQWVRYLYDAMGRRVAQVYSDSWTSSCTIYDGLMPIAEFDGSGNPLARYYHEGLGRPIRVEKGTDVWTVLTDDRGSVVGVVNPSQGSILGEIVEKLHYNMTGLCRAYAYNGTNDTEKFRADGSGYNLGRSGYVPFGYLGMYHDPFTGLYHTHFREYDAVHGRWLSEDPAGYADGLNLYQAYMGVNGTDPLGLGEVKLKELDEYEKIMHETVRDVVKEMEEEGWSPPQPDPGKQENPGAFGNEVHKRVSERLSKKKRWIADVYVDNNTNKIMAIGSREGIDITNTTQIDLVCLEKKKTLKVGDVWDQNKVHFISDIKTGAGMKPVQKRRLEGLAPGKLKISTPEKKWTRQKGWHANPKFQKIASVLMVVGAANALHAMAHADEYNNQLDDIYKAVRRARMAKDDLDRVLSRAEVINATTSYIRNFVVDDTALDIISTLSIYEGLYHLGE